MIDAMDTHAATTPGLSYDRFLTARKRSRVVDVLPEASFREGHIPGALSLPLPEIPTRTAEIIPDKRSPIIVYCAGPT